MKFRWFQISVFPTKRKCKYFKENWFVAPKERTRWLLYCCFQLFIRVTKKFFSFSLTCFEISMYFFSKVKKNFLDFSKRITHYLLNSSFFKKFKSRPLASIFFGFSITYLSLCLFISVGCHFEIFEKWSTCG